MIDEARLRQILHDCFAEVVEHLFLFGVHNAGEIQRMSDRIHVKIDTLEDE